MDVEKSVTGRRIKRKPNGDAHRSSSHEFDHEWWLRTGKPKHGIRIAVEKFGDFGWGNLSGHGLRAMVFVQSDNAGIDLVRGFEFAPQNQWNRELKSNSLFTLGVVMITEIGLDGHDSELFSFLPEAYKEQLRKHPAANVPLWTFGDTTKDGALRSVPMWNGFPGCLAWTEKPHVEPCNDSDKFVSYRGFVCRCNLVQVAALALVRHYYSQGYSVALDDELWLTACDPQLTRLSYIRGWGGKSTGSPEWQEMLPVHFDWALEALERVPVASSVG